ncbi:MAG: flavin reductase family protein [Myxococcaceae bacterium]|jgi:flavin reductase (DIM6/NTAB) family NADH-FMN oxidoreductase RutF|nr:flavin reductase family protein [Myxococcaceae bacterium]
MRTPVPLKLAYRLLNHGPTTLITSAHGGRRNVMAAAWVMPLDFEPPKLAVVVASGTETRRLVDASGALVVHVPTRAQLDLTWTVGSVSGADVDKFVAYGIATAPASQVDAPLIEGCAAWLECRVLPKPDLAAELDLFVVEVLAAWADDTVFDDGAWHLTTDTQRHLHHVARGRFFLTGAPVDAALLEPRGPKAMP